MKNEQHIPTIVGIIILLAGMLATIFLIENNSFTSSQAAALNTPQKVTIANITDNQFSVIWTTNKPTISHVSYQEKGNLLNQNTTYDIRDLNKKSELRFTHLVTITDLKPNTNYTFSLINSNKTYSVNTFTKITAPKTALKPAFGKVEINAKEKADILLLGDFPQAQTVASVVNEDGTWILPLNSIRIKSGSNYNNFKPQEILSIQFMDNNNESQVKFTYDNASPLPLIRLGENYNFANLKSRVLKLFISEVYAKETDLAFKVIFPNQNAGIPTQKPIFKGTGNPKQNVIITLNGPQVLSKKITIDENGNWNFIPETNLEFGKYSASFVYLPTNLKNSQTIGLNFMILKSGSSVLADATPSGTLKTSPLPSSIPSSTPKSSPSLKPSFVPSPIASTAPTPVTGNTMPTIAIIIFGSFILLSGLSIVFLKKRYYYKIRN